MRYESRLFAFIDVLGFADRVITRNPASELLPATLREILDDLRRSAREFKEQTGFDLTVTLLSDTVIASAPEGDNESALEHFFWCVRRIASFLLSKQFLVRGCILQDMIHHDDQIIVGPAIVYAYRYESRVTKFPRLAIIGGLRNRCLADEKIVKRIRQSSDGPWYLHTLFELEQYAMKAEKLGIDNSDFRFMVSAHEYISDQLKEHSDQPAQYEKLLWFAQYFDETVVGKYTGSQYRDQWPKRLSIVRP
jgi:hypothetical protein